MAFKKKEKKVSMLSGEKNSKLPLARNVVTSFCSFLSSESNHSLSLFAAFCLFSLFFVCSIHSHQSLLKNPFKLFLRDASTEWFKIKFSVKNIVWRFLHKDFIDLARIVFILWQFEVWAVSGAKYRKIVDWQGSSSLNWSHF